MATTDTNTAAPTSAKAPIDHAFWHNQWETNQTGWRAAERRAEPFIDNLWLLQRAVDDLSTVEVEEAQEALEPEQRLPVLKKRWGPGSTVFLPLCGDTPAIGFFASRLGVNVVGVDLSENAVRNAIAEQLSDFQVGSDEPVAAVPNLKVIRLTHPAGTSTVTFFIGDAFELLDNGVAALGGSVDLIYDRGSFVALHPSMRARYLAGINGILHCATPEKRRFLFLNAVERVESDDRDELGPPFHVEPNVVFEGYASLGGQGRAVAFVVPLGQPDKHPDDPRPFFDAFYAVIKM